jgi:hypothetical protein
MLERPHNTLQQTGGTALFCDSVVQAPVGGGSAPAAERGAFSRTRSVRENAAAKP